MLLRPGWIVTHLIVIAIVVLFVNLGLWQLDRHAERQDEIARTEAALAGAPVPLDEALGAEDVAHRPTTATGTYLADGQVQLSPRSNADRPGYEVLTPLALADGRTLVVNRGWMPLDSPMPLPPAGEVAVEGRLQPPTTARQVLPPGGDVAELVSSVDLARLSGQVDDLVTTAYLERVDEEARTAGDLPLPAGPVSLDAGNHLSYAVQWVVFAAVGLIGYPLLLRRRLQDAAGTAPGDGAGPPPDPADAPDGDDARPGGRVERSGVSQ